MTDDEQELAWREGMAMSLGCMIRKIARDPMMLRMSGTEAPIHLAAAIEIALQQIVEEAP